MTNGVVHRFVIPISTFRVDRILRILQWNPGRSAGVPTQLA